MSSSPTNKIAVHVGNLKTLEKIGFEKHSKVDYLGSPTPKYFPELYRKLTIPVKRKYVQNQNLFFDMDIIFTVYGEPSLIISCKNSITDSLGKDAVANCDVIKKRLGVDTMLLCRNPRLYESESRQRKCPVCFEGANFANHVVGVHPYMMERIFLLNDDPVNQMSIHSNHLDIALPYFPHGLELLVKTLDKSLENNIIT